jgi:Spy/CpxP family protein refolding chaperone
MSPFFTLFYIYFTSFYILKKHSLQLWIILSSIDECNIKPRKEKIMGKRKKYFVVGGIVLLIVVFTGFGLVAARGPCRGFHRGFHPGFHHKDVSEFVLWRLDKGVEELDLSEAQKGKYEEMKGKLQTRFKEHREDRKRFIEELQTAMNKEGPDVRVLSESLKTRMERFSDFMQGNLDLFVEFYEILDQGQKEKIMSTVRERMKRCRIE